MLSKEVALATALWELEQQKAELSAQVKDLNASIDVTKTQLIDYLVDEGKTGTGHISGVGALSLVRENFPSVISSNLPTFIDSIRGTDDFGMVKETIPAGTLKKFLKDKIEQLEEYFVDNEAAFDKIVATLPEEMEPTISNAVKYTLSKRGVQMFSKVGLQHRNKGKV